MPRNAKPAPQATCGNNASRDACLVCLGQPGRSSPSCNERLSEFACSVSCSLRWQQCLCSSSASWDACSSYRMQAEGSSHSRNSVHKAFQGEGFSPPHPHNRTSRHPKRHSLHTCRLMICSPCPGVSNRAIDMQSQKSLRAPCTDYCNNGLSRQHAHDRQGEYPRALLP